MGGQGRPGQPAARITDFEEYTDFGGEGELSTVTRLGLPDQIEERHESIPDDHGHRRESQHEGRRQAGTDAQAGR